MGKIETAAYCRVTMDKDAQLESLENHMAAFNMRIAMHPGWKLANLYVDEGLSEASMKQRGEFLEKKHGVELYFEKEKIDTADTMQEMLVTIRASFAQEESQSISENVKRASRSGLKQEKRTRFLFAVSIMPRMRSSWSRKTRWR